MAIRRYHGDLLVEEWDVTAGYSRFNRQHDPVQQRPLTDAELVWVQAYDRDVAKAAAVDQAQQTVDGIQAQSLTFEQQLQADITAVQAGWATLDGATQTAIMLRILNGFATVQSGLQAHAAVTGAIDPLATPDPAQGAS